MAPTAATLAALFSVAVYIGFWFAAPSFAQLSGVPEATPVIRLLTVTILIDGCTSIRTAYLLRTFQQGRYVLANAAGIVANGVVAIGLSLSGAGPLALASGQLASALITGLLVFVWAGLPIRFGIDWPIARRLLVFGVPLAASLGIEAILEQSDKVIVGNQPGAGALGFFLKASSIAGRAPGLIGTAIRFVSLPGFARLSERDEDSLSKGVAGSLPLLVLAVTPIAVLFGVMATPTISFLYGSEWLPAEEALRFLMILMVVRMVTGLCMDILMSTGATRWTLVINIGWVVVAIPAIWFGTRATGTVGAAAALAAVGVLVAVPLASVALHRVGVRLGPLGRRMIRPLLAGALADATAFLLDRVLLEVNAFVELAVAGMAGLLVYLLTAIPRRELRLWIATRRSPKAPPEPAAG